MGNMKVKCFPSMGSLCEICAQSDFRQVFLFCFGLFLISFSSFLSPLFTLFLPFFSNCQLTQLKQMKELEQEKDSLLAGLEVVERARDWYQGQIHNVTERQRQVGQSSHCTVSSKVLSLCVVDAICCILFDTISS